MQEHLCSSHDALFRLLSFPLYDHSLSDQRMRPLPWSLLAWCSCSLIIFHLVPFATGPETSDRCILLVWTHSVLAIILNQALQYCNTTIWPIDLYTVFLDLVNFCSWYSYFQTATCLRAKTEFADEFDVAPITFYFY